MYIIYYYINVYPVETTDTTCFSFKLIYNYTVIKFWKLFPQVLHVGTFISSAHYLADNPLVDP